MSRKRIDARIGQRQQSRTHPARAERHDAGAIHPLIVHATVDSQGSVIEAEPLSADAVLSDSALNFVRSSTWGHSEGGYPGQRELFVNVIFVPKQ